ncbi:RES family NAD+ phosphorylase [Sulfuriferula sp.]|uniref:RES family NAD+ phosphorylase n=1 Tax=Sulfuriferula sp. TaxID=2025307 RepID=UPI00273057E1|nr:RES family NAD+ phosphorylase [Sulfuriferula sp.]MDP2024990.1 RES family NAD+ phosphorylase [Sulfuriferula sp.]
MNYPRTHLTWSPAWRVIPTRFPAVNLFDRVASPQDFEALYALEAMTNDRIRDEVGLISLVPSAERLFGNGSGPIMAAFTHLNPQGSRFSDGSYGVFYCAHEKATAIAETRHHAGLFLAATHEASMRLQMRLYTVQTNGEAVDLREAAVTAPRIVDPDDYGYSQGIGRQLRAEGVQGILYPSVRKPDGECLAALRTGILHDCLHSAYLEYNWNGRAIDAVFEVEQIS